MTEIVEEFVTRFKQRNLTMKRLATLSVDQTRFHLFGTWNEIRVEGGFLKHFKMKEGGAMEQVSTIAVSEIGRTCYIPYEDSFILFKEDRKRRSLTPEFVYTKISMFSIVDEKRKFLHDKGFKIRRRIINLNLHSKNPYTEVDVF